MAELRCERCGEPAVYPSLCSEHFSEEIKTRFRDNVRRHKLFSNKDRLVVAVSGGKDSLTTLYLTKHLFKNEVQALAIDEGICNYRDRTIPHIKKFCKEWDVPLHIRSFKDEFGFTLDDFHELNPCSVCGVLRRYLLNKLSRSFGDVLVTGHNLDDEVQSIVMNLMQADLSRMARMGWIAGVKPHNLFIPRVKPMREISERETTTYWFANFPDIDISECPYARTALRTAVRESLNEFEHKHPGSKRRVLGWFDSKVINVADRGVYRCRRCGEPSSGEVCEACETLRRYAQRRKKG